MTTAHSPADRQSPTPATGGSAPRGRTPSGQVVRSAVVPSLAAGLLAVGTAAALAGGAGALGAVVGTACVLTFFGFGHVALTSIRMVSPWLSLVIALMTYALQVLALLAVYALFQSSPGWREAVSSTAVGLTVLACTGVWLAGLLHAARRTRTPIFETGGGR